MIFFSTVWIEPIRGWGWTVPPNERRPSSPAGTVATVHRSAFQNIDHQMGVLPTVLQVHANKVTSNNNLPYEIKKLSLYFSLFLPSLLLFPQLFLQVKKMTLTLPTAKKTSYLVFSGEKIHIFSHARKLITCNCTPGCKLDNLWKVTLTLVRDLQCDCH